MSGTVLTAAHVRQMSFLPDEDGPLANVDVRLAMIVRGEHPADWDRVKEINDLDYTDFMDYQDPLQEQMADRNEPDYAFDPSGIRAGRVRLRHPWQDGPEEVTVKPLKGRDRRLMDDGNPVVVHQALMCRMTGLSAGEVVQLRLGDYQAVSEAMQPFLSRASRDALRTTITTRSSVSPAADS